jgi:putative addiction module component (TIGR02574 family)
MSPNIATVLAAAESLSIDERRELIALLLEGLGDTSLPETQDKPPGLSEAWGQEVTRRSAEYDAGQAATVSWEEVQSRWPRQVRSRPAGNTP